MQIAKLKERAARQAVTEVISRHVRFRGKNPESDGRITLLTVNYHAPDAILRLVRSFRTLVDPDWPVVVVENGAADSRLKKLNQVLYRRPAANLHHALGLDYGMCSVNTEWTLVCDPDSAIIGRSFAPRMLEMGQVKGVAGIESAHRIYHPICLLFKTEIWKLGGFSFLQRWPWWDVAGELTHLVGGRTPNTLLKRTRVAGPRFRFPIYLIEVYEDLFTNTYLGSRVQSAESDEELGLPRAVVKPLHERWTHWVDAILDGSIEGSRFPFREAVIDENIYEEAPLVREEWIRSAI